MDKMKEYYLMYNKYKQYEQEYWKWAEERKQFEFCRLERKYWRRNGSKTREKYSRLCVADFPKIVLRDLHSQVGGTMEIVASFNLVRENDYYYETDCFKWKVFYKLKNSPDLIYDYIENTYESSIILAIRTALLPPIIADILDDIGNGRVW